MRPFSRDFVRHLPGGYAQKHPDEDWSETFAVWMTPALDWRTLYGDAPGALEKLLYCERTLARLRDQEPELHSAELDYDVGQILSTVQQFYEAGAHTELALPQSLDADLRAILGGTGALASDTASAALLSRSADALVRAAYRFTGTDPDLLRRVVDHLSRRAVALHLQHAAREEPALVAGLAGLLTALAMNQTYIGDFISHEPIR